MQIPSFLKRIPAGIKANYMKNITKKHFRYTLYCGKIKLFRVDMGILCFVSLNVVGCIYRENKALYAGG